MRGERVAVVEVTFLEIARRHVDLAFRTERDGEGTTVGVDVDDRSALAVRHAEPTVIATRQDDLAGGKASAANFQLGCAKSTPGTHPITRPVVQVGDIAPAVRDNQRLLVRVVTDGPPPVFDQSRPCRFSAVAASDAAVLDVCLRPAVRVPCSKGTKSLAIPVLTLPADLAELTRTEPA